MRSVNKRQIADARDYLGETATMTEVAVALGIAPSTIRTKLTLMERHLWALTIRKARRADILHRAALRLKTRAMALGRVPTARESAIHTSVMTKCGGYNAIVAAAGLEPRKSTKP